MDKETKEWIWEIYKTVWAVILIERVSALCTSVHQDEDAAKSDCEELLRKFPQNRYTIVCISIKEFIETKIKEKEMKQHTKKLILV